MENILEKIVVEKKRKLARTEHYTQEEIMAFIATAGYRSNPWHQLIRKQNRAVIIAEIKMSSPSRGKILESGDILPLLNEYHQGGASAISVVTEEFYFKGGIELLQKIIHYTPLPVLRKDFILEETQIYESAQAGVNALLLIARILSSSRLQKFIFLCELLKIIPLVEVHDQYDLEKTITAGAHYIGINNRNLSNLEVSLSVTDDLLPHIPAGVKVVCESGIHSRKDIIHFMNIGIEHFLIGEHLLFHPQPCCAIKDLKGEEKNAFS